MQDIPLQTPPGNYNPSWLRKNRVWLLLIVLAAASAYGCAVVVTTLGRPEPSTMSISIVASDAAQLKASPKTLHQRVAVKDLPSHQEFELRNLSSSPITVGFSLLDRGYTYPMGVPGRGNQAPVDEKLETQVQGSMRMSEEIYGVKFGLEAVAGQLPDGSIAPNASARFRLTAISEFDQKDGEHFIILTVSVSPATR
jgi:hypothetical protein